MPNLNSVLTRAAQLVNNPVEFKTVVHESRKKKRTDAQTPFGNQLNIFKAPSDDKQTKGNIKGKPMDFKKAQKDVINFGVAGISDRMKKDEAEIALAITLGAKPPKKVFKNYKTILEEKRKAKQEDSKTNNNISKKFQFGATQSYQKYVAGKTMKKSNKKQPKNVLEAYGKVKGKEKQKGGKKTERRRNKK